MTGQVICGDCCIKMQYLQKHSVKLVFADPPFNIGYEYDQYDDRQTKAAYVAWTREWLGHAKDLMRYDASLFVPIGDDMVADVKLAIDELGFPFRNWIVWHYTFGTACTGKFSRSHTHILYYGNPKSFNPDAIRVPSDRQTKYKDKRANPKGKIPDDTWLFPRVCGTFKERTKEHPCQMPEAILERIIKATTKPGDLVLDPFAGSGTTLAVAKNLGRDFIGIELSEKYVAGINKRLKAIKEHS